MRRISGGWSRRPLSLRHHADEGLVTARDGLGGALAGGPLLDSLRLQGFRNLRDGEQRFAPGRHLLLGDNGSGKTSLLEAIYIAATTRSFRARQLTDCCRHGSASFHLRAETAPLRSRLEVACVEGRKLRCLNGSQLSLAEHLAVLPVLSWTAADGDLLDGPPELRRRFVDRGVLGTRPSALEDLTRYRKSLEQKRELLRRPGRGALEPWNLLLASSGAALARQRQQHVEALERELRAVVSDSGLELPRIELRYRPSPAASLEGEERLAEALFRVRLEERRRRQPLIGPQRDQLLVLWGDHEIQRVASAGERKAVGLLLLAAQARVLAAAGRSPLLLLDDVDTELDHGRMAALWKVFCHAPQLFATSNRAAAWSTLEVDFVWRVQGGRLRPSELPGIEP